LGHSQIDTTMKYAMVNQNNVKISHKKYISWFQIRICIVDERKIGELYKRNLC
jgi:hypothetical protein